MAEKRFRFLNAAISGGGERPIVFNGISDEGETVTIPITVEEAQDFARQLERQLAALSGTALPQRQAGPPQPGRPFRVICGGMVG